MSDTTWEILDEWRVYNGLGYRLYMDKEGEIHLYRNTNDGTGEWVRSIFDKLGKSEGVNGY